MSKPAAAAALALFLAGSARAASGPPQAAKEAVQKAHPGAKVTSWRQERGEGGWSASLTENGAPLRVDVDATGAIVSEERRAKESDLPDAVRKSLAGSSYARWTIVRVERVSTPARGDDVSWELTLKRGERLQGVRFEQDGRMAEHESLRSSEGNEQKARREVEREPAAK